MACERNIFLVGPMGSGKTTIGKLVASEFGLEFHDSDQELERLTGASVNLIFDVEGEAGFRERETRLLRDLIRKQGVLIATGGGAVTSAENRRLMRRGGLVIWLKTSVAQQLKRLSHDKARPLLQAPDRKARLEALAQQRNPLYHSVADFEFTSPEHHIKLAAQALIRSIRDFREAHDEESTHAKR